ncbi:hypothetical protein O181_014567 [Austropuccinia psidii MF-1]|uniref:Uncharacterized protein n=1 Tax=Austropuccinia psidii MF-1 TaxID=1389203 RepID=A0A9Q3GPY7_9BASI|nr:hypothetical protein [Austropuccinia psidii MF-1]
MLLQKTPVICATILDAQFKIQFFTLHESTLEQFGTCAKALQGLFEREARKNLIDKATIPSRTNSANVIPGLFHEIYSSSSPAVGSLENKLNRFLVEPTEPKSTDVLIVWKA